MIIDHSKFKKYVNSKYGYRFGLPTVDILDVVPDLTSERITTIFNRAGSSSVVDLVFLRALCKTYPNCKMLQIGIWRGESVVNIANCVDHCYGLDIPESYIPYLDNYSEFAVQIGLLTQNLPNFTFVRADSTVFDFKSLPTKFDVILIDGSHISSTVTSDSARSCCVLSSDNSVILWHDYAQNSDTVNWAVLSGILDGIPPQYHKYLCHVSNTNYAMLSLRQKTTYYSDINSKSSVVFDFDVTVRRV